jgi:hypothetical protein
MNIPKIIAELRSELERLEASIRAFEPLENSKESGDILTAVESAQNGTAMGTTRRKALRSSDRPIKCAAKRRIRKRF